MQNTMYLLATLCTITALFGLVMVARTYRHNVRVAYLAGATAGMVAATNHVAAPNAVQLANLVRSTMARLAVKATIAQAKRNACTNAAGPNALRN